MRSAKCLLSQRTFQTSKVQTKAETIERNTIESVKQQTFTLRIIRVHSFLERGVNYLLTGIMKNMVLMVKRDFEINHNEY